MGGNSLPCCEGDSLYQSSPTGSSGILLLDEDLDFAVDQPRSRSDELHVPDEPERESGVDSHHDGGNQHNPGGRIGHHHDRQRDAEHRVDDGDQQHFCCRPGRQLPGGMGNRLIDPSEPITHDAPPSAWIAASG